MNDKKFLKINDGTRMIQKEKIEIIQLLIDEVFPENKKYSIMFKLRSSTILYEHYETEKEARLRYSEIEEQI